MGNSDLKGSDPTRQHLPQPIRWRQHAPWTLVQSQEINPIRSGSAQVSGSSVAAPFTVALGGISLRPTMMRALRW